MGDSLSATGTSPEAPEHQHEMVRSRYRAYAPNYDRRFRRYTAWSRAIVLDAIRDLPPASRVLDVCCGTGVVTAALADHFPKAEIVGVDLSQAMLARAQERLEALGLEGIHLCEAPAEKVPVESGSVDLAVCANAFHLLDRQEAALSEFARVTASGGRVVILDWTLEALQMRWLAWWLKVSQRTRRRVLTRGLLADMAKRAGLEVEVAERVHIPPAWGLMVVRLTKP
ncbi:MAG: methyltransferase domain-containing protein [Phycisphaeraceae bacterium]|nr:methyltransferase domain-containing protein [Phycisphaeraceae bacterium]